MGILSFNGNKIITTSGGGALISDNINYITNARFLATQARDAAPHYQHSHIGYNYRMSNVCAAIGRGQLEVLPQRVEQRRANYSFYTEALKGLPGISFLPESTGSFSNRWLTTIIVNTEQTGGLYGNLCTCSQSLSNTLFMAMALLKNSLNRGFAFHREATSPRQIWREWLL
jgi:dTDP-4-amino-4,6-dideoxygalactose transaminase